MNRKLITTAGVAIVLIVAYVSVLLYSRADASDRTSDTVVGEAHSGDYLEVTAKLLSVTAEKEEASVRLAFVPHGALAEKEGSLQLANGLKLHVNTANGAQDKTFDKGKAMAPFDATLDLTDGTISDYPFDRYTAELFVDAVDTGADGKAANPLPVVISFHGALHGLDVTPRAVEDAGDVGAVSIDVQRSSTTVAVAVATIVLLGAMGLVVLAMLIAITIFGRKLEPPIIALMGALLFGFVAFRNASPGTPGIGTFSDFLAFFWAEAVVAVALFSFVFLYFKRTLNAKS